MDFIIDTVGDAVQESSHKTAVTKRLLEEYNNSLKEKIGGTLKSNESKKVGIDDDCFNLLSNNVKLSKRKNVMKNPSTSHQKQDIEAILKKSIITPDFESLHCVPSGEISKKKLKKLKQQEREKTKGNAWYGLPATEVTEEVKRDLEVLQMRSALDPKHFYKKNDLKVLPKYFHIGKVLDSPLDHYNNRLTKKQRKRTLVDELLADAAFNKYNKRKYKEIIMEKQKTDYKAWRNSRKSKKRKDFSNN